MVESLLLSARRLQDVGGERVCGEISEGGGMISTISTRATPAEGGVDRGSLRELNATYAAWSKVSNMPL